MIKVVFIAGLPHSGSTLLSIILGKHPSLVGVGEVRNVLGPYVEHIRAKGILCSCGNTIDSCQFWGRVSKKLDANGRQTIEEQYQTVLHEFEMVFGSDRYFVDASKKVEVLDILRKDPNVDLRVIHLIRDVRSFTMSAMDKTRKRRERKMDKSSRLRVPSFFFWHWYRGNRRIQQFVQKHKIPVLQVAYEDLCLHTKSVLEELCAFLAIEPLEEIFSNSLSGSRSHVIRGNHMRFNAEGKSISYDLRWIYRNEWLLPAFFFQSLMKFNALGKHDRTFSRAHDMLPQQGVPSPQAADLRNEAQGEDQPHTSGSKKNRVVVG